MGQAERLPDGRLFEFWEKEISYKQELHVDCNHPNAGDDNDGSRDTPFKTIQAAADRATPGTHVWIHKGEYREQVAPKMGGAGPESMICYEAVEKDQVIIKASEQVTDFAPSTDWRADNFGASQETADRKIWEHRLDPEMFKGYNPFCAVNILHDRLFIEYEKTDMTPYLNRRGMVFCDGTPLKQVALYHMLGEEQGTYWVEANGQVVHFRLPKDEDPKNHNIEITCREQCFAPTTPFLSFIKVKGIVCAHAAMGAPVPQRGSISAYRGHHWVIEDCTVDWSNAVGIDVGNECWHHDAAENQQIGFSVIRRCKILDAGVCGIAGLYARNMLVEDNLIEGTGWQKMELSWEAGGIKLHNSIDGLFRRNIFRRTYRADHLWLDCGNENNRITQNLFLDGIEQREAIFIECTREGINLIDHNIFWNVEGRFDPEKLPKEPGSTGWYKMVESDVANGYAVYGEGTDRLWITGNLMGKCRGSAYYAKPVSFRTAPGLRGGTSRDAKVYDNIIYSCSESAVTFPTEKNDAQGNCYVKQVDGGYLRIMYPAPEVCLDLRTWREFYGFDTEGREGWFDIQVDTNKLELVFRKSTDKPFVFPSEMKYHDYVYSPDKLSPVTNLGIKDVDFFGEDDKEEKHIPGPFRKLEEDVVYQIDPRMLG